MTNLEKYAKELLHDAFCAENEGGSNLSLVLPDELRDKYFWGEYDIGYDDFNFKPILDWLNQESIDSSTNCQNTQNTGEDNDS